MLDGTGHNTTTVGSSSGFCPRTSPKNDTEEEGCFLPTPPWEYSLPADKTGRMPPATSSAHAETTAACASFPCRD